MASRIRLLSTMPAAAAQPDRSPGVALRQRVVAKRHTASDSLLYYPYFNRELLALTVRLTFPKVGP